MENNNIFEIQGLTKTFIKSGSEIRAVDNISFYVKEGETLGLVGESGCGKSTTGRLILDLIKPSSGRIMFDGKDVSKFNKKEKMEFRRNAQIIFQDCYASLSPRMRVGDLITEALSIHHIGKNKAERREIAKKYFEDVTLSADQMERYPHEFSGGQRQRIGIARALCLQPKLIVCDEPVSALDVSIQAQIINLLKELQEKMNLTYLFISHDLSVVEHISDTVGVMYLGGLVETGNTSDIFENPLHPYTKALFSAIPMPDPDIKINRTILEGDIPSPANPPSGCKFHTRCKECMGICKEQAPEAKDMGNGHIVRCHLYD